MRKRERYSTSRRSRLVGVKEGTEKTEGRKVLKLKDGNFRVGITHQLLRSYFISAEQITPTFSGYGSQNPKTALSFPATLPDPQDARGLDSARGIVLWGEAASTEGA